MNKIQIKHTILYFKEINKSVRAECMSLSIPLLTKELIKMSAK